VPGGQEIGGGVGGHPGEEFAGRAGSLAKNSGNPAEPPDGRGAGA
jgi:hypothetical protein